MELSQVLQALRNADAAGDVEAARRLAQIADRLMREQQAPAPQAPAEKPKEGIGAAFGKGLESGISSLITGLKGVVSPEEAAREGRAREEDIQRRYADQVSLEKVKQAYRERGLLSAAGEAVSQVPAALAEQAPNIAATLGSARLGAMAGAPFGVPGAIVGGLAGAALPSLFQQAGSNIQRQAAEGQPISRAAAYGAAVPQAALDVAGTFIPLGRTLAGKALGPGVAKMLEKGAEEGAEKLAKETLLKTLTKGTAVGALAEIPTEVTQQMLERVQAGLPLLTEDALKEYGETAYQVSLLAPIGAAGRVAERGAARERQEIKAQEAQAVEAKARREREEAEKQSPDYARNFMQQHEAMQKEYNDLGALLKQKLPPGSSFAEKQVFEDQKKRRKELGEELKGQAAEYNRAKAVLAPILKAEADARAAEQQARMQEEQQAGPMQQLTLPGMEPQVLQPQAEEVEVESPQQLSSQRQRLRMLMEQNADAQARALAANNTKALTRLDKEYAQLKQANDNLEERIKATGVKLPEIAAEERDALLAQREKKQNALQTMAKRHVEEIEPFDPEKRKKIEADIAKIDEQLTQYGVSQKPSPQAGLDMDVFPLARGETRAEFGARVFKPGALDIEAQEQALLEEQRLADEQAQERADREQAVAAERVRLERIGQRPAPVVPYAFTPQVDAILDRMAIETPPNQNQVFAGMVQQLQAAPETLQLDRLNGAIRTTEARIAETGGTDVQKTRLSNLQKARATLEKAVYRKLFDVAEEAGQGELLRRVDTLKPTGAPRRAKGEFQLFGEAAPAAREVTREDLQARLTRAMASNKLSDDAYEFLSRVESTLPETDRDGIFELVDQQLQRIESGAEGMARPGAGRITTLQAFPTEGRADVTAGTLANAEDMARQYLLQQKLAEGMKPAQAREVAFKATNAQLAAAADEARNPSAARILRESTAAVTKRPARDLTPTRFEGERRIPGTVRGPSAKAEPLSLQEELEPLLQQIERAREEDMGQMQLFTEGPAAVSTERATPGRFQRFLESAEVKRLRALFEPVEKKVERAREKLNDVNSQIKQLTGVINDIEGAIANAYPAKRVKALRAELATLKEREIPEGATVSGTEGITQRIKAIEDALRIAEEQEAKLKAARKQLRKDKITSLQEELASVEQAFGSVLQAVTRRGQLKAAINELQLESVDSLIDEMNISAEDKRLLKEQARLTNAIGKHRNALDSQFNNLSNALGRIDAFVRVVEADQKVRDYEANEATDRAVLAMAKRELRMAQTAAAKLIKEIGQIEGKTAAQAGAQRRLAAARNRADEELKRTERYKAQQEALERRQRAPEGVDKSGQPLRAVVYDPITDAERAAREDDTPTILAVEMRQVRGNPQQVLKGYRAQITTITKKLREAFETARQQTVDGVKERAPYEAALAAYTAAKTSTARANIEPSLRKLETAYNNAITNALNARVMPKGLVGYQDALAEMLRREAWLSKLIDDGTVEVAEPPKPRKRKTEAELKEIQAVLNEKEIKEAAARVGAPELDITQTTKSDIEAERKPKGTLYSAKGVGQETLLDEQEIARRKEAQVLLQKKLTPAERAVYETNTIIKQAQDKQARSEKLSELEQLLLGDYSRSRQANKAELLKQNKFQLEPETAATKGVSRTEEESESFEDIAAEERESVDKDFGEVLVAEPDIAGLFGTARADKDTKEAKEARDAYLEQVDKELRSAGTSTLARVATRRGQIKEIERQLAFMQANKNGPVVDGQKTLSPKQAERTKELTAQKEQLAEDLKKLESKLAGVKAPKDVDVAVPTIDGATPTLEQLAATATQGPALKEEVDTEDNAAAVMQNIAKTSTSELNRTVAERLKMLLGNTRVEIVDDLRDPDGQAAYGQAASDGSFIRLDSKYGLNERTVLHEGVHAATERVLQMPDDQLTDNQRGAKQELQDLFEAYKKLPGASNANAKTSLSEFVSEALSDDVMQAEMRQQRWTLGRMWDSFKSAILRALGIDTPTDMLAATLAAADALMTKVPRPTAQDNALLAPTLLNRPRNLNPALSEADAVGRRIIAKEQSAIQKARAMGTGLAMETSLIDRFAGFERLSKYMDKLKGTQMMYYLRMYDQRMNFTSQSAANGAPEVREVKRRDGETEFVVESKTGPSLKQVVTILKGAKRIVGDVDATSRLFSLYLVAKRAERVGFDKVDLRGQTTEKDIRAAVEQIKSVDGLQEIFETARDVYNQYNENLVRFAQQAGVFNKRDADALLRAKDYVPYYRERNGVVELTLGGMTPVKLGNIKDMPHLQELIGGEQKIIDFMVSSVQNTNMLVDMSLRNLATRNAVFEFVDMGMAKLTGTPVSGTNVVRFKHNGDDRYAILDTDRVTINGTTVETGVPADLLVKGMEGIPVQTTGLLRIATVPTQILRRAITLNPLYMVRQLARDSLSATVASGADMTPVLSGLKEISSGTKATLEKRGITGGQVFTGTQEDISKVMRDIAGGQSTFTKALGTLEMMGMEADALTRRAQYNSYIKQGMSEMEATMLALESMNFNKRGASPGVHLANSLYPFFNAQIQGLNVLYRAMFGQITAAEKARLKQKFITRGAMMFATSLAYAHAMQDDEAYKNALPAEKYGNWFLRLPGVDEPVRIPVPFEIGYIFKALPEALYNSIVNGEKGRAEAKEAFAGILRNVIPGGSSYFIPQVMKPAIEVATNYSFFTERPMMSAKEQALLPEYQYRNNTTELAKLFGGAAGVSPAKLEALISGYFSTAGMALLQLASLPIPVRDTPEKAERRLSEIPVFGSAFQPNDARWLINSTYDALEDARRVQASYKELVNRGEKAEAKALLDARANDYAKAELAGYYRQQMGMLSQYRAAVNASNKTPQEKREMLDKIRQHEIRLSNLVRQASDAAKVREA